MYNFFRKQSTLKNSNGKPWNLQLAKWSPVGHSLAIVDHYNLYYIQTVTDLRSVVQLTTTGDFEIYNGIPDWVYEGECIMFMYLICIFMYFRKTIV